MTLNVFDIISTIMCMSLGLTEKNPLMNYLFVKIGAWNAFAVKLLLVGIVGYGLLYVVRNQKEKVKRFYLILFRFLNLIYFYTAITNLIGYIMFS